MQIMTTSRLSLTHLETEDADFILTLMNDADCIRHIGDKRIHTLAQAEDYIEKGPLASYARFGFGLYKVSLRSGMAVGICGLLRREGMSDVEIGYALLPQHRGKGYAREACQAVLKYGYQQLGLNKIVAIVSEGNLPSEYLLQRLGLRYQQHLALFAGEPPVQLFVPIH